MTLHQHTPHTYAGLIGNNNNSYGSSNYDTYRDNSIMYQSDLYRMRGQGIGSIFSHIYNSVIPLVKKALRIGKVVAKHPVASRVLHDAKKTAMKAGINVVGDAMQGKNIIKSTKEEVKKAQAAMGEKIKRVASNLSQPSSNHNTNKARSTRTNRQTKKPVRSAQKQQRQRKSPRTTATSASGMRSSARMVGERRGRSRNKNRDLFDDDY